MLENGTLQPYLRRVLTNLVRDRTRSVGRGPTMRPLKDDDYAVELSPVDALLSAELIARYRAALATLSPRERTALRARLERGLAYRDVARRAGCVSSGAARVMVGRALARVEAQIRKGRPGGEQPRVVMSRRAGTVATVGAVR